MICGPLSDSIALTLAKRNGGVFEPEMRLWLAIAFTPLVPAGLFMFGIGLNNGSHWLLPAFGLGISAVGIVPPSSAALTYLTDAYTDVRHGILQCSVGAPIADISLVLDHCGLGLGSHIRSQPHLHNLYLRSNPLG